MLCPKCQSAVLPLQVGQWTFECVSGYDPRVDAWRMGCGYRFSIRPAFPVRVTCHVPGCDANSDGKCVECQRPLCKPHGHEDWPSELLTPDFICAGCLRARAQRKAAAAAADARRHRRCLEGLRSAQSPAELLSCLRDGDERLPLDLCVRAWVTVVRAGLVPRSAALVNVRWRRRWRFGPKSWLEDSRLPAWGEVPGRAWVDGAGDCWTIWGPRNQSLNEPEATCGLTERTYVVTLGQPYRKARYSYPGATPVFRNVGHEDYRVKMIILEATASAPRA